MLVFDTETTGLLKPELTQLELQPYIIEFGVVRLDEKFKVVEEYGTFIKPPVPLPPDIVEITGITDKMLKNAPSFIEVVDDIADIFRGQEIIYAHNCSFDINMLVNELTRYDLQYKFPWPSRQRCTVEISHPIKNKRLKLIDLYEMATGSRNFRAHRALDDTKALAKIVKWLHKEGFVK
jgi:DNA polymerase-3 subunit alpha (Gram-positive type)